MDKRRVKGLSKFMSLLLRHRPQVLNLTLDKNGWVAIDDLIAGLKTRDRWTDVTLIDVQHVVETNSKKRFEFSEDGSQIRARQGHSVKQELDLGLKPEMPPRTLFHGTVARYLENIKHHVHLSSDRETATNVGDRRGKPVILVIRSGEMADAGNEFYLSNNGVWLTEHIPPDFICFPE